jgi:hypothetical protein
VCSETTEGNVTCTHNKLSSSYVFDGQLTDKRVRVLRIEAQAAQRGGRQQLRVRRVGIENVPDKALLGHTRGGEFGVLKGQVGVGHGDLGGGSGVGVPVDRGGGALLVEWVAEDGQTLGGGRLAGVVHVVPLEVFLRRGGTRKALFRGQKKKRLQHCRAAARQRKHCYSVTIIDGGSNVRLQAHKAENEATVRTS